MAVAKVERAHEPRTWSGWAASRHDVAALTREAALVLGAQTGDEVRYQIRVPGFEREFESPEELLDNVDGGNWEELRTIGVSLSSGDYPNTLYVWIDINAGLLSGVRLSLSGGSRLARNAVEPELVALVARHERRFRSLTRVRLALVVALYLPVLIGVVFLNPATRLQRSFKLEDNEALVLGVLVAIVLNVLASFLVLWIGLRVMGVLERLRPEVELLPDDRVSRWERARASGMGKLKLTGVVVAWIATVIAAVAGVAALR
jgi:hypothetical protein